MDILLATVHWFSQPEHWFGDAGILLRLREHIYYVLISIAIASAIALPLGIAGGKAPSLLLICLILAALFPH